MIECKRFRALIPETTCILRQKAITSSRPNKFKGLYGGCAGCEIGLKLLKEVKMARQKACKKCGESYPVTEEYFDYAPRALDGFTNDCKECRAKAAGVELSPPPPAKTKKTKSHKLQPGQEKRNLHINISTVPGLYVALKEKADDEMRTPLAQALWILKEELI